MAAKKVKKVVKKPRKPKQVVRPAPRPVETDSWSETSAPMQRVFVGWLAALALGVLLAACIEAPVEYANVCEEADAMVQRCGTTVPLLTDTPCTGVPRLVSQCVADHANGCDDLAELARNPDRCFPDAGELPEPEPLPVPEPDRLDGGITP